MIWLSLTLLGGYLLDVWLGEPKRFHPLIGFGYLANQLEHRLNFGSKTLRLSMGIFAWCLLVLPIPISIFFIQINLSLSTTYFVNCDVILDVIVIYWALGHHSLRLHGLQIFHALKQGNLAQARVYCSYIVSRETQQLSEQQISRATTESMLENGHDAVLATLVSYLIGGAPLVIIHRLANTLDAMWGYRNKRFNYFGRFSARADDVLGFLSAKITSVLFAVQTFNFKRIFCILKLAYQQAKNYKSHNGGWVMSSGATLMKVQLGGKSIYHGEATTSPALGQGTQPQTQHVQLSLTRVNYAALLLISIVFIVELIYWAKQAEMIF